MKTELPDARQDDIRTRLQLELGRLVLDTDAVLTFDWNVITDHLSLNGFGQRFLELGDSTMTMAGLLNRVDAGDAGQLKHNLNQIIAGETEAIHTFRYAKNDGQVEYLSGCGSILPVSGSNRHVAAVLIDQTSAQKRAESEADIAEDRAHLIKNTLNTVSGIAAMTQRTTRSAEAFVRAFNGRLQAIAKSAELVASSTTGHLPLTVFVALVAAGPSGGKKISVKSCGYGIGTKQCQTLAIAIHELTMNAVIHGALASDGTVVVSFEQHNGSLKMIWREESAEFVPPSQPAKQGFGWQVLSRMLAREFDTRPEMIWNENGFQYELVISADHLVPIGDGGVP